MGFILGDHFWRKGFDATIQKEILRNRKKLYLVFNSNRGPVLFIFFFDKMNEKKERKMGYKQHNLLNEIFK